MTVLSENVEDLLKRLETSSKSELNLIRALSDAIRQVDDQTLRELRNLSRQHEMRRESILGELQMFASRLCQLPARPAASIRVAIDQPAIAQTRHSAETVEAQGAPAFSGQVAGGPNGSGADWRKAAQNIQDDLDLAFATPPRH